MQVPTKYYQFTTSYAYKLVGVFWSLALLIYIVQWVCILVVDSDLPWMVHIDEVLFC